MDNRNENFKKKTKLILHFQTVFAASVKIVMVVSKEHVGIMIKKNMV